jgi:ABC-2 type transport system permease protein
MRTFRAGLVAQAITLSRSPNSLLALATMPLATVVFLAAVRDAGRPELVGYALIAPALMAQWAMALLVAGELVTTERWQGTLELVAASPTSFPALLAGRVAAVTALSTTSFAEVWAVAALGFDIDIRVADPAGFLAAAVATSFAVAGWAVLLAAALVLSHSTEVLRNTLTFPFYLLGGVLVPVSFLPEPMQWLSRALFLSWSADLLRDTYRHAVVTAFLPRLGTVVALGLVGFVVGGGLLLRSLHSLRSSGRLGLV